MDTPKTKLFSRQDLRRVLHKLYNERVELTMIGNDDVVAGYLDYHNRGKNAEEIPYYIGNELITQGIVEITSGNEHYGEENFVAVRAKIVEIVEAIRCDVGDTVKCLLKDYDDVWYSGFVTGWTSQDLDTLYINDIRIVPSKVMLTRKVLLEKIQVKPPKYGWSPQLRVD